MYDGCFGLSRRPFASVPQIDRYFPANAIEGARTTLARCIQRGEGAGLVIGPSGTGKTLLCLILAEQFRRSFQVVMLQSGRLSTRRALFQAILYELGQPYRGMDEGETRLAVVDYLMAGDGSSRGMVLLVDEAHTLPMRLLEEIRLLTNLVRGGQPLVRAVLAGASVLEERLASPKLDSFNQRLSARCYLEVLNRTETERYIHSQINSAGGRGELVFPEDTCQSVFQATGGVPRLVNQLCDHALLLTYVAGRQRIDSATVEEAWGDLQQLPTPCSSETKRDQTAAGVVEFGTLDDQPSEASSSENVASDMSTPTLRITSMDEEQEIEDGEPARQICRIERLLAEADDDFQPAGSIGPEAELCFEESAHPFQEEFEHEEVVADRYAVAASPSQYEPVLQWSQGEQQNEGREWPVEPEVQPEMPSVIETIEELESVAVSASVPAMAMAAETGESELGLSTQAFTADEEQAVEELQGEPYQPPVAPAPAATERRREYRQLFTRLRRG
jgi:type II secretory pathway predicted ATPase ExeA